MTLSEVRQRVMFVTAGWMSSLFLLLLLTGNAYQTSAGNEWLTTAIVSLFLFITITGIWCMVVIPTIVIYEIRYRDKEGNNGHN
jgi:uncharacterized membrane protein YesL